MQTRDDEALPQQPGQQYHQEVVEPVKPSQKDNSNQGSRRQAVFYVKMASSDGTSSGGASSSGGAGSSDTLVTSSEPSDSVEDEAWFDCEEQTEWLNAQGEQDSSSIARDPTQHSAAVDQTAATLTPEQQACLKKLPSRLLGLLTKYLEVGAGAASHPGFLAHVSGVCVMCLVGSCFGGGGHKQCTEAVLHIQSCRGMCCLLSAWLVRYLSAECCCCFWHNSSQTTTQCCFVSTA